MKQKIHENCYEQMYQVRSTNVYALYAMTENEKKRQTEREREIERDF